MKTIGFNIRENAEKEENGMKTLQDNKTKEILEEQEKIIPTVVNENHIS